MGFRMSRSDILSLSAEFMGRVDDTSDACSLSIGRQKTNVGRRTKKYSPRSGIAQPSSVLVYSLDYTKSKYIWLMGRNNTHL